MKERRLLPLRIAVAAAAGFALTACLPASPKESQDSSELLPPVTTIPTLTPDQIVGDLGIRVDNLEKQIATKEKQVGDILAIAREFINPGYFEGSNVTLSDFLLTQLLILLLCREKLQELRQPWPLQEMVVVSHFQWTTATMRMVRFCKVV